MTTRVQRITAYLGEYEEVIPASNSTFSRVQKIRPADDVALITTTPAGGGAVTNRTEYAHRDSLGSLDVVTDASGNVLTRTSFDPFGGRRESNWSRDITAASLVTLLSQQDERESRGFTDHEQLRTGFMHMNGRVYDPRIGRFVSMDR